MLSQNPRETPDFAKGIVKPRGHDADRVWLAKIVFCVRSLLYSIDSSIC
jgi:hypothetical protein